MRMPTISKRRFLLFGVLFFLGLLCCCRLKEEYTLTQFLEDSIPVLGLEKNNKDGLRQWGVSWREEEEDTPLNWQRLSELLCDMAHQEEAQPLRFAQRQGWIGEHEGTEIIERKEALAALESCVKAMNSLPTAQDLHYQGRRVKGYEEAHIQGDIVWKEGKIYRVSEGDHLQELSPEDFFEDASFAGSTNGTLEQAHFSFYGEPEETGYVNTRFQLLAAPKNLGVWNYKGFRISYNLSSGALNIHISKKTADGNNRYVDLSFSNLQPAFRWDCREGNVENAKMVLDFHLNEKVGLSRGKMIDIYTQPQEWTRENFLESLRNSVHQKTEEPVEILPLCKIKLPFPQLPFVELEFELAAHFYIGGKVELSLHQHPRFGFEIYRGNVRFIHDFQQEIVPLIRSGAQLKLILDLGVRGLSRKLANVYLASGLEAYIKSQLLFLDAKEDIRVDSEGDYETLQNNYRQASNVKLCGEMALEGSVAAGINNVTTLLGRWGFGRELPLLKKHLPLLGSRFIENGLEVQGCRLARPGRPEDREKEELRPDKILLQRYSYLVAAGSEKEIALLALPESYRLADLVFESENETVATVRAGLVSGKMGGSTRVRIATKDGRYEVYCHILVSDGK